MTGQRLSRGLTPPGTAPRQGGEAWRPGGGPAGAEAGCCRGRRGPAPHRQLPRRRRAAQSQGACPAFGDHEPSCSSPRAPRLQPRPHSLCDLTLVSHPLWSWFCQQLIGAEHPPKRQRQGSGAPPGRSPVCQAVRDAPSTPLSPAPATPPRIGTAAKIAINPVANNNTLPYQFASETLCNCRTQVCHLGSLVTT